MKKILIGMYYCLMPLRYVGIACCAVCIAPSMLCELLLETYE